MSEELRKNETEEVEGHVGRPVVDEPGDEGEDDEVEAHTRRMNSRMDTLRKD
jgi:hypothetical protein